MIGDTWQATVSVLALLSGVVVAGSTDTAPMHLYLLIGQSNMAGRGRVAAEDKTPHPRVFVLNKADEWAPAVDPLHFDKPFAGVGPGLAFGKAMAEAEARIGLIPCAAGGSPISVWRAGEYWGQTRSKPYDEAIRRTKLAMKSGELKGILWHQGESDSRPELAGKYADRLADLVARLRKDLGAPDVPFVVGGLGDFALTRKGESKPAAVAVQNALKAAPKRIPRCAFVDASGLQHKGDGGHFSAPAARELGRRYAKALLGLK
jgi:hypothetical protein